MDLQTFLKYKSDKLGFSRCMSLYQISTKDKTELERLATMHCLQPCLTEESAKRLRQIFNIIELNNQNGELAKNQAQVDELWADPLVLVDDKLSSYFQALLDGVLNLAETSAYGPEQKAEWLENTVHRFDREVLQDQVAIWISNNFEQWTRIYEEMESFYQGFYDICL